MRVNPFEVFGQIHRLVTLDSAHMARDPDEPRLEEFAKVSVERRLVPRTRPESLDDLRVAERSPGARKQAEDRDARIGDA